MIRPTVSGSCTDRMPAHEVSPNAAQANTLTTQTAAQISSLVRWMRKMLQNRKKCRTTNGITPARAPMRGHASQVAGPAATRTTASMMDRRKPTVR